uniref:Cytochrome B n=1 Tax=Sphingobacterium sp. (strain 21) TaxID=743722 RepID=F4C8T1_SPHS2
MYSTLLVFHSLIRWLVLAFLLYSIYRAFVGYLNDKPFSKTDNAFRHWTATIAHIQLMIGIILYTQSPIVKYFWRKTETSLQNLDITFYGIIHIFLMLTAIVLLTIGSALAKRQPTDKEKFKTMLVWFSIALIFIFIAVPWTFSPFSSRPNFRTF